MFQIINLLYIYKLKKILCISYRICSTVHINKNLSYVIYGKEPLRDVIMSEFGTCVLHKFIEERVRQFNYRTFNEVLCSYSNFDTITMNSMSSFIHLKLSVNKYVIDIIVYLKRIACFL